jgi:hypothetical protein
MVFLPKTYNAILKKAAHLAGLVAILSLAAAPLALTQDQDRDRDRDRDRIVRVEPGTVIPVRTNESIDVDKGDNRVYAGVVDQDVYGDFGRLVIPRGSIVEMMVRYAPDNDLILDLNSVVINGRRFGVRSDPKRYEARQDDNIVGAIVGALNGGHVRGRAVRVPRDSVVTFRLARPLEVVEDRGFDRDGQRYRDNDGDRPR